MTDLTILDIASGRNLEIFGEVDKKRLQQIAVYYVKTAGTYFPQNTKISDYYSSISSEASETEKGNYLRDLQLLSAQLSKMKEPDPENLKDIFSENPRLVFSLNNYCNKGCMHCVPEATAEESDGIKYEDIIGLDPRYFNIFKKVDFGRKGDPMLWKSESHDISDLIEYFFSNDVEEATIATGVFKDRERWYERVTKNLEIVHSNHNSILETMITYHHYFPDMKADEIASVFNKTLQKCSKFSDKIVISIIGDRVYDDSSITSVQNSFLDNFDRIFNGFGLRTSKNKIIAKREGKNTEILIPLPSDAIHPLGRFEKKLKKDNKYDKYLEMYNKMFSEPSNCPDGLNWPGIVIEPNGDINMCGAFEAIANPEVTVVSNIFKPFEKVEEDLLDFYEIEKRYFKNNFPDIAFGRKSTCKIKNVCYLR